MDISMLLSPHYLSDRLRALLLVITLAVMPALAFSPSHYPTESVLATGKWMKVSVPADGLYMLSASTLRSWGFSNPMNVRVYGWGGKRMNDLLTESNYPGDLPLLQTYNSAEGVVFYGQGPGEWVRHKLVSATQEPPYWNPNPYATAGYYFVTENADLAPRQIESASTGSEQTPETAYFHRLQHKIELSSPGYAGPLLTGEDFRYTRKRSFSFDTPDLVEGEENLQLCVSMNVETTRNDTYLNLTVNGEALPRHSNDHISKATDLRYGHGKLDFDTRRTTVPGGTSKLTIGVELEISENPDIAALNLISISYLRKLDLGTAGYLDFWLKAGSVSLANADNAVIWDVTVPSDIKAVAHDKGVWHRGVWQERHYAAWRPGSRLPSPKTEGWVDNQNLHGDDSPDMIIVSPAAFMEQARRIVDYHSDIDTLRVLLVEDNTVYNEFSSGSPEPAGLRNFFKMHYDRAYAQGRPLRYALLVGRLSCDYRRVTSWAPDYPLMPAWTPWEMSASLHDNMGYYSDDFVGMLTDNSGTDFNRAQISIAIGRMPVTDVQSLRNVVDKTKEYIEGARKSAWKHRFLFVADDGDRFQHLDAAEKTVNAFANRSGQNQFVRKVYLHAFEKIGNVNQGAKDRQNQALEEGVVWWNFNGHASATGWTADGILTYSDINTMYLRHIPFIAAFTCDFLRMDSPSISGAEIMYTERYGGCIGVLSALRPVYISNNDDLSAAVGRALARRGAGNTLLTPGEIARLAKNDLSRDDTNRLRYFMVGDPALPLAMPSNLIRVDSVNNVALTPDNPGEFKALQRATMSGSVTDPLGNVLTDFNGTVNVDLYDADSTTSVKNVDDNGNETWRNFEEYGSRIFSGSTKVVDGRFTVRMAMPLEISQNYRPATLSMFAWTDDGTEAVGLCRDVYAYGYDEEAPADTVPPVIEQFFLNHSSFTDGSLVNAEPMMIATVRDETGLNLSTAGIGHQMLAILDGVRTFSDISTYFTPATDGSSSGSIAYPMPELTKGSHTLALRIWDTSGNSAVSEINFQVNPDQTPKIYDVYTDSNPARDVANFYLSHDQPDRMLTVTIEVFNLAGSPVWSGTVTGKSDMFLTVPVSWDLTDRAGHRVNRGIYLYRASITADGNSYTTASRRLAVGNP